MKMVGSMKKRSSRSSPSMCWLVPLFVNSGSSHGGVEKEVAVLEMPVLDASREDFEEVFAKEYLNKRAVGIRNSVLYKNAVPRGELTRQLFREEYLKGIPIAEAPRMSIGTKNEEESWAWASIKNLGTMAIDDFLKDRAFLHGDTTRNVIKRPGKKKGLGTNNTSEEYKKKPLVYGVDSAILTSIPTLLDDLSILAVFSKKDMYCKFQLEVPIYFVQLALH